MAVIDGGDDLWTEGCKQVGLAHPMPMLCEPLTMSMEANMLPPMEVSPGHVRMASLCMLLAAAAP